LRIGATGVNSASLLFAASDIGGVKRLEIAVSSPHFGM